MTAPARNVTLSAEQEAAVETACTEDRTLFLTGNAGTGKTTVTNAICDRIAAVKCATTGAAAINCGGVTVDRMFSINRDTWEIRNPDALYRSMQRVPRTIIIDEGASCGAKMSDLLWRIARDMDKRLILVGDFAQTAPVKDEFAIHSRLFRDAKIIRLRENHRQDDRPFLDALNAVRIGEVNDQARRFFRALQAPQPDDDTWVRLYATNARTDAYNQARLQGVNGASTVLTSSYRDLRDHSLRLRNPLFPGEAARQIEASRLADGLEVRIGARVMLLRNVYQKDENGEDLENPDVLYVNGDAGIITQYLDGGGAAFTPGAAAEPFSDGFWGQEEPTNPSAPAVPTEPDSIMVLLDRTGEEVRVHRYRHEIVDPTVSREPIGAVVGFPVNLGYAVTIFKAQGQTLHRAYVDIGSILNHPLTSRHGLAYVALSRARNPQGLRLSGWYDEAVYCSPQVRNFL